MKNNKLLADTDKNNYIHTTYNFEIYNTHKDMNIQRKKNDVYQKNNIINITHVFYPVNADKCNPLHCSSWKGFVLV